jgi:chromosome partitioning protein
MTKLKLEELILLLQAERVRRKIPFETIAKRGGWPNESNVRRLEKPDANPTLRSIQRYALAIGVELKVTVEAMRVMTFFNHAGGVGKSSTVRDIGFVLSELGFRVLLIDADPQANLTSWLGMRGKIGVSQTIWPAVLGEGEDLALPVPLRVHGLDLIPSSLDVARIEPQLLGTIMGVTRLRNAVRKLEGYDFVLIDPPPSLGQLSALAVIAADHVVVPLPTNSKGLEGLDTVFTMVKQYRQAAPGLGITFFILTQHDERTRHDRESLATIRTQLPAVASISSPLNSRPAIYKDAQIAGQPIPAFAPNTVADEEIRLVTSELLEAMGVSIGVGFS